MGSTSQSSFFPFTPSKATTSPDSPEFLAKHKGSFTNFSSLQKLSTGTLGASPAASSNNSQSMVPLQRYFSVTVGSKVSKAKFYVENTDALTSILRDLAKTSRRPRSARGSISYRKEDDWVHSAPTPAKQAFFHSSFH